MHPGEQRRRWAASLLAAGCAVTLLALWPFRLQLPASRKSQLLSIFAGSELLHGPVSKAGAANRTTIHPASSQLCEAEARAWTANTTARPCLRCQVFGNKLYKLLYVRRAKTASTSVLDFFGGVCDVSVNASAVESGTCLKFANFPVVPVRDPFGRPPHLFQSMEWPEVEAVWKDFFVFTVVRDPLSRAVSSYKYLLQQMKPKCKALVDWDGFCSDPLLIARICARHGSKCCHYERGWSLAHVDPQAPCLRMASGGLTVDYVVRSGHLEEDLHDMAQLINTRLPDGVPPIVLRGVAQKKVTSGCPGGKSKRLAKHGEADVFYELDKVQGRGLVAREQYCSTTEFYEGRHAHCLANIRRYYADDFRLLYGRGARSGSGTGGTGSSQQRPRRHRLSASGA